MPRPAENRVRCRQAPLSLVALLISTSIALAAPPRDHVIVPEDYFDIAAITAVALSADGTHAAYVESRWAEAKERRRNDLWVVNLKTRAAQRLTFDGFGASDPVFDAHGRWIYFSGSQVRPAEDKPPYDGTTQVWRVAASGGEPFCVTRADEGVGHWALSRDASTLFYTTSEEVYQEQWRELREEFADLQYGHGVAQLNSVWKLDLASWRAAQILPAERVIHDLALSANQQRLAMITTEDEELIFKEGWSQVEVLELDSGQITQLTDPHWRLDHPSGFGWLEELAWSADGRALAFSIGYDGYASRIHVAEQVGGGFRLREVKRPAGVSFDSGLAWRGTERTLCFLGEEKGRIRVYACEGVQDGGQGKARVLTEADVVTESYSFSESGREMVAVYGTTAHLADIFRMDRSGRAERITNVNPQVDSWQLPQISLVSWTGGDGDTVEGILELPHDHTPSDGPLPLIVELHGGPTSSTKYRLRLWIYGRALMAANGYALFSPNYHGSTGYGDEFLAKLIGRENEIEVTDILTGVEELIARGIADRDRIGVMGWSNGGYLTNCLITAAPDLFAAASSGAGVLDMVIQWGTEDTPGHVINYMQGLPWENPEAYRKASPLYDLGRVKTPTLIHVGGSDPRVPPAHSRALYRALQHYLIVPTELVVYPGESHGLSTRENRLAKMKWDLAWFDKYLKQDSEVPDK